jgi:osmotically-inducible protein OsmY
MVLSAPATLALAALLGLAACVPSNGSRPVQTTIAPVAAIDDAAITGRIKAAFTADPALAAQPIHVESDRGAVQLSGYVGTLEIVRHAGAIAAQVPGVASVDNHMIAR